MKRVLIILEGQSDDLALAQGIKHLFDIKTRSGEYFIETTKGLIFNKESSLGKSAKVILEDYLTEDHEKYHIDYENYHSVLQVVDTDGIMTQSGLNKYQQLQQDCYKELNDIEYILKDGVKIPYKVFFMANDLESILTNTCSSVKKSLEEKFEIATKFALEDCLDNDDNFNYQTYYDTFNTKSVTGSTSYKESWVKMLDSNIPEICNSYVQMLDLIDNNY